MWIKTEKSDAANESYAQYGMDINSFVHEKR